MTDERAARVHELLEHNIRSEIGAQNSMSDLGLSDRQAEQLAWAIAAEVDRAFSVDWDPDWVRPGEVHHWTENGQHFARCPVCLGDSPAEAQLAEAVAWAKRHRDEHDESGSQPLNS